MTTLVPSFLDGSSSFLQVIRTPNKNLNAFQSDPVTYYGISWP